MEELRDHAHTGVEQPYEVPYLSKCIVMNLHSLVDPLVGERQGRSYLVVSGFPFGRLAGLLSHVGKVDIRRCVGRFSHLRCIVTWGLA